MADRKVRLFIGTRKGAYIAESDVKRKKWTVKGPAHEGADVFHVNPDPRHPGTVYAAVNSYFFGPLIYRSKDWGKSWKDVGTPMMARKSERPAPKFDGTDPKPPVANIWNVTPGHANEPDTVFTGIDPGSLYRSDDQGETWEGVDGINNHATRSQWNPGAGGLCLHTIQIDPNRPSRMYIGISAAGTFRTNDAGDHWTPTNKGVGADFLPDKAPEVGQCVHKIAMDPENPAVFYRQDHGGIHISRDSQDSWTRVGKVLDSDFGFVTTAPAAMPGGAFFVPLNGESRMSGEGGLQIYWWSEKDKKFKPTVKGRPWPGNLGTHRDAFASDRLDPAGLYLGTTTGNLLFSPDGAKTWDQIPYYFPGIHSVTVASPEAAK